MSLSSSKYFDISFQFLNNIARIIYSHQKRFSQKFYFKITLLKKVASTSRVWVATKHLKLNNAQCNFQWDDMYCSAFKI